MEVALCRRSQEQRERGSLEANVAMGFVTCNEGQRPFPAEELSSMQPLLSRNSYRQLVKTMRGRRSLGFTSLCHGREFVAGLWVIDDVDGSGLWWPAAARRWRRGLSRGRDAMLVTMMKERSFSFSKQPRVPLPLFKTMAARFS